MSNKTPREIQSPSQGRPWLLSVLLTGLLVAAVGPASAGSLRVCDPLRFEQVRDGTIAPLMAAMMTGNTTAMASYLSEQMASRYRVLLTENLTYPDYLREFFKGAAYQLRDVMTTETGYAAVIEVYWADGSREVFDLDLGHDNPYLSAPGSLTDCQTIAPSSGG